MQIAQDGISPRTVEVHRARIMEKTGARNTVDLVRIVLSGSNGRMASPEMVTWSPPILSGI